MAEAKTRAARRPISRTYEGVQWFKHGAGEDTLWLASVPGTNLALVRRQIHAKDTPGVPMHEVRVAAFNHRFKCWDLFMNNAARFQDVQHGFRVPWTRIVTDTVGRASRHVMILRNNIKVVQ